ncbi:TniQ family protein [Streptomyces sp. 35G-GA-8]|uniref:TniQ family protein n=1 Tax=Streptomyces sp. 35G-GA-8 TaxID=2939434 RepID=UPI00201F0574|nr:TniQ family protein [Streptomyces sp. 35G-GA-8]MCL7378357.1 TniQ family protein [Streptomyces sp. 35G-GA-8]
MTPRPLPRTLAPLEDESLVGLILRLAHHSGSSPAAIALRMGLAHKEGIYVPAGSLLELPPRELAEAAHVAGLSVPEMENLLLAPLGERYGPLSQQYDPWYGPQLLTNPRRWVHLRSTQFCERCLAGNGSSLRERLGGAWKRHWHLPVVFACVEHRRMLRRHCPYCGRPAHAARRGLIAHASQEDLHPTQCRASSIFQTSSRDRSVCGASMAAESGSRSISSDRATREEIIGLQRRIDALLSPNGPSSTLSCGEMVSVAQYFMDLRAVTALIFASWPLARPLAATEALARAAERDGERRQRSARDLRSRVKGAWAGNYFLAPPDTALATSAVLGIAERLLKAADNSEERAGLIDLYQPAVAGRAPLSRRLVAELGASPPLCRTLGITPRPRKASTRSAPQMPAAEAG